MWTLKKGIQIPESQENYRKVVFLPTIVLSVCGNGLEFLSVGISLRILDPDLLLSQQKLMAIHPSHEKYQYIKEVSLRIFSECHSDKYVTYPPR